MKRSLWITWSLSFCFSLFFDFWIVFEWLCRVLGYQMLAERESKVLFGCGGIDCRRLYSSSYFLCLVLGRFFERQLESFRKKEQRRERTSWNRKARARFNMLWYGWISFGFWILSSFLSRFFHRLSSLVAVPTLLCPSASNFALYFSCCLCCFVK